MECNETDTLYKWTGQYWKPSQVNEDLQSRREKTNI